VRAVKRLEVVVEAEHEAHPLKRGARRALGLGVRAQQHVLVAPGRLGQRKLVADPQRPPRHGAFDPHQSARAGRPWWLAWPRRPYRDVHDLHMVGILWRVNRWRQ